MNRHAPMLPGDDVRETPPDLFSELNREFSFTLDVCATPANAKLEKFLTETDDGIDCSWQGHRCWCNPPFSDISSWVTKAWKAMRQEGADLVVMLVPATRTEQAWWHEYVEPFRDRCDDSPTKFTTRFLKGRTRFLENGKPILDKNGRVGAPKFGCVLLIWHREYS